MFKHIVMWRFIDGANGKSKQEHALWVKENLEALVGIIPEIKSLEVGVNVCMAGTAYDAVLVSAFDDADAMERYKVHPAHVAVAAYFKGITEGRAEADYNI
ncbi:MAG: Dabb family protein [Bacteroidaceae bacterium]|nr:Dabb family protein [Bacteroidaceae bacterium]MBQ2290235.1 Dabb family protein [Bacteroidaceae bacterium]MBQ5617479.1 Dabb family protein [Bacteroidaceae bacterium]